MFSSCNVEIALRDGIKQQLQKEESGKDLNLEDLTEGFLAWSYLFHSSFDQAIYLLTYLFIYLFWLVLSLFQLLNYLNSGNPGWNYVVKLVKFR